jgi:hypothetical protein
MSVRSPDRSDPLSSAATHSAQHSTAVATSFGPYVTGARVTGPRTVGRLARQDAARPIETFDASQSARTLAMPLRPTSMARQALPAWNG